MKSITILGATLFIAGGLSAMNGHSALAGHGATPDPTPPARAQNPGAYRAASSEAIRESAVLIEHIGACDKPIRTIVLSDLELGGPTLARLLEDDSPDWIERVPLSRAELGRVLSECGVALPLLHDASGDRAYGTFRVTITAGEDWPLFLPPPQDERFTRVVARDGARRLARILDAIEVTAPTRNASLRAAVDGLDRRLGR